HLGQGTPMIRKFSVRPEIWPEFGDGQGREECRWPVASLRMRKRLDAIGARCPGTGALRDVRLQTSAINATVTGNTIRSLLKNRTQCGPARLADRPRPGRWQAR